jgi:3-oxoadipate enol-lactonase
MPVTASRPWIRYHVDGTGPPFVLSHALGCSTTMWDPIAPALADNNTVIRFDTRGHGGSEVVSDSFSLGDLVDDAVRLIDELQFDRVTWIGLSLGGMIGQGLAIEHPDRVGKLVIANSVSRYPEDARAQWHDRARIARSSGMAALADLIMTRYFSEDFRLSQPDVVQRFREGVLRVDARAYAACCEAIAALDYYPALHQVRCPTLAIAGEADVAATPGMVQEIADRIPGAAFTPIPAAGHLSVVEHPDAFLEILKSFMDLRP